MQALDNMQDDQFLDFLITESNNFSFIPRDAVGIEESDEHGVPMGMVLTEGLRAALPQFYDAALLEIAFGDTADTIDSTSEAPKTLRAVLKNMNRSPTICLVLRRPGCCFCREDGQELTKLCHSNDDINLIGIVKDTNDKRGLHEFHKRYFPFPMYQDVDLRTYEGLGNRRIGWSVLGLPKGVKRIKEKNIEYNMKDWADTLQGGILIFDGDKELRYTQSEEYADQVRVEDIQAALKVVSKHPDATIDTFE